MTVRPVRAYGATQQMAQKDPNLVARKWTANLSGSTESITNGVNAVTVAPGDKAAAAKDLWVRKTTASADKWADRVRVPLDQWRTAMLQKGLPRVASGAQAAEPKMAAFMSEFLPHVERVAQQVRSMPKGSIEDGIARASAQIRGNAQFRRSGR